MIAVELCVLGLIWVLRLANAAVLIEWSQIFFPDGCGVFLSDSLGFTLFYCLSRVLRARGDVIHQLASPYAVHTILIRPAPIACMNSYDLFRYPPGPRTDEQVARPTVVGK
ncbi:hypothetical protein BD779DRAFT_559736 [Infundibulicybe gibba]|nr:hypothetical protein BD779DRAFT_559736 [Infundibulicybe gibba]